MLCHFSSKLLHAQMDYKSNAGYVCNSMKFILKDHFWIVIHEDSLHKPIYKGKCSVCAGKVICNGFSDYGKCR